MQRNYFSYLFVMVSLAFCSLAQAASDPADQPGAKDPKLFSRMPGFHIYNATELAFDRFEFFVAQDKKEAVEGYHHSVNYYANEGAQLPSGLQIVRNYVNAAKKIGGQQVYGFEDGGTEYVTLKVALKDSEVWVQVFGAGNGMYSVDLVEKKEMTQDVVADAVSMAGSLGATGKVAVYGIYFDTDKAEVKAESEPALKEIVKLLQADAALKLYVVGHTDNVGGFEHNIRLSKERATSVVNALTAKHGVAAARLLPYGDGPTAPVAANDTDGGRAKNRRVELVKQ